MKSNGKILEKAVYYIEKHVLQDIPLSDKGKLLIEPNKIIYEDGVKHEIDLFVKVDLGIGTPLIYIFECKNWAKKSISKNDIIIFD